MWHERSINNELNCVSKDRLLSHPPLYNAFWQLMETAFPPEERRTETGFRKQLESDQFFILLFLDQQSELISFVTYWNLIDFIYIEHLAVVEKLRGKGKFSLMLNRLELLNQKAVIFEVEPPETPQAVERMAIYHHKGFYSYVFPYLQPPYSLDKPSLRLILMGNRPQPSFNQLEKWVKTIQQTVYSARFY